MYSRVGHDWVVDRTEQHCIITYTHYRFMLWIVLFHEYYIFVTYITEH